MIDSVLNCKKPVFPIGFSTDEVDCGTVTGAVVLPYVGLCRDALATAMVE